MDARRTRVGKRPAGASRDADDHGRRRRRRLPRVEPLLRELGTPNYIGDNGQGLALKLAINISLAVQMLAFAEGLLLAERSGIDRQRALDVMEESPIGSPMLRARASIILDPPEEAWFDLRFMHKDIELALEAPRRLGIPLPRPLARRRGARAGGALGYERRDLAVLFQALEDIAAGDSRWMLRTARRPETLWPPAAAKEDGLPPLLIVLTIVTGVVDALAYLRLGHVFVANMTGNVVFLGFAAAGAGGLSVSGIAAGHRVLPARRDRGRPTHLPSRRRPASPAPRGSDGRARPLHDRGRGCGARRPPARGGQPLPADRAPCAGDGRPERDRPPARGRRSDDDRSHPDPHRNRADSRLGGGSGAHTARRVIAVAAMLLGAFFGALLLIHLRPVAPLALAAALLALVAGAARRRLRAG